MARTRPSPFVVTTILNKGRSPLEIAQVLLREAGIQQGADELLAHIRSHGNYLHVTLGASDIDVLQAEGPCTVNKYLSMYDKPEVCNASPSTIIDVLAACAEVPTFGLLDPIWVVNTGLYMPSSQKRILMRVEGLPNRRRKLTFLVDRGLKMGDRVAMSWLEDEGLVRRRSPNFYLQNELH